MLPSVTLRALPEKKTAREKKPREKKLCDYIDADCEALVYLGERVNQEAERRLRVHRQYAHAEGIDRLVYLEENLPKRGLGSKSVTYQH